MTRITKILAVAAATAGLVAAGAYAFAQSHHGFGPGGMGRGMMFGMGPGMMMDGHGSATPAEHAEIRDLFFNHDRIRRTVTNLPDGIRTVTESDDPELARVIISHVTGMGARVEAGSDPLIPIESEALHRIFRDKDKIKSTYETTAKGIIVVQTSTDPETVSTLQQHAAEVSDFVNRGMAAAHEAMMRNRGGLMHVNGQLGHEHMR